MLFRDAHTLVGFGLCDHSTLDLDLVLTVGWWLVAKAGFKWLSRVKSIASCVVRRRDIPVPNGVSLQATLAGASIDGSFASHILKRRWVYILS